MQPGIGLPLAGGGGGEGGREGGGEGRGPGSGGCAVSLGLLFQEVGVPGMPPGFCALPVLSEAASKVWNRFYQLIGKIGYRQ